MTMERKLAAVVQQTEGGTQLLPPRDGQQQHPIEVGGRCNDAPILFMMLFSSFYRSRMCFCFLCICFQLLLLLYFRYFVSAPLIGVTWGNGAMEMLLVLLLFQL